MAEFLDATPSGTAANSYLTLEEMDDLADGFEPEVHGKWDDLRKEDGVGDEACRLLVQGTRRIDQYRAWGPRHIEEQRLAFPRELDVKDPDAPLVILEEVRLALAEYVAAELHGRVKGLKELQEEGVTSTSILGQSASMEADPSGLPAGTRRELDKLWNTHWPTATKNREIIRGGDPDANFFG